jgi:hypothetical protein
VASYLPGPKDVRDLLTGLLGRPVDVRPGAPLAPTPRAPCTVGVYVDDSLRITALTLLDLRLSAHAGAAIGLVPVVEAATAIEDGVLADTLRENLSEVLNVAAALFNVDGADHLRLYDVHHVGVPLPGHVLSLSLTLGRRQDLTVDVAGYGSGRMSVLLVR